ncbi:MAG TPA: hypothetical protein VHD62_06335 [Opitutaceae bacterium]|nr:hypothetical protein [Opitutaceae bacterium]
MSSRRFACCFLALVLVIALRAADDATLISIVAPAHPGAPAQHGLAQLAAALSAQGWAVENVSTLDAAHGSRIVVTSAADLPADTQRALAPLPARDRPESLAIKKFALREKRALLVAGADDRGLMYALLDVADRVGWTPRADAPGADPFREVRDIAEAPFIRDRSLSVYTMNRAHWESRFYDERYWTRYFDLMAADRFNRFLIVFGYENGGFLAPPYPYFFDTPGFDGVHMVGLTREQQQRNLAALNRLIALAHARGIAVSFGIWDHIYRAGVQTGGVEWIDDYQGRPVPNTVEGVTTENLSAYTLASLRELLARVPGIDGIQFRVHEESGLKREEMDGFWRVVFEHVQKVKPGLLLEARGKGTPDSVIDTALALGVNLRVETKFWMEQMGLPFHPSHVNLPDQQNRRHGYADFLRYPQRYQMDWRLWNGGTSRVLLWGDPDYVRRYSASAQLYDSPNWDVQEPLATKMEAQRPEMPDFALMPEKYRYYDYEFERYWHFFQVWGRVGYDPQTPPDVWQHEFQRRFGAAAPQVEAGLHRASQVLPMIVAAVYPYSLFPTTRGWAERQSLGATLDAYAKNQGTDTEQFENFAAAAQRILAGGATAKRTPDETSRWFDDTADAILASVRAAEARIGDRRGNEFDSTITDLKILAQLARFHARRAIAAVHYNLFKQGQKLPELLAATYAERDAVAAWRELVAIAGDRYNFDLAMGARNFNLCGHWRDELVKLEADVKDLEAQCCPPDDATAKARSWQPIAHDDRAKPLVEHTPPHEATPGQPLRIVVRVSDPAAMRAVRLRYRHVTQFEDYATIEMQPTSERGMFAATIPGEFITSKWDVMYFVEAIDAAGHGTIWPDFAREAPYVILRVAR